MADNDDGITAEGRSATVLDPAVQLRCEKSGYGTLLGRGAYGRDGGVAEPR